MRMLLYLALGAAASAGEVELVRDPHFKQGFRTQAPELGRKVFIGRLAGPREGEPLWDLAQWSTRFPLATPEPRKLEDGGLEYANEGKQVILAPAGERADLTFGVVGSAEYGHRARLANEPWVHLLAEQSFEAAPRLTELKSLRFHVEARLLRGVRVPVEGYTPNLHAAQFQIYLTIQNLNQASAGFGDYYWFGVPIYDDRWELAGKGAFGDPGTGKLIYCPAESQWTRDHPRGGDWVTLEGDLLPKVIAGLRTAWERGFLKGSHELADYRPGGMNVGWEVPGVFNVAIQVRGLSVRAGT